MTKTLSTIHTTIGVICALVMIPSLCFAEMRSLNGTVTYHERMALPVDAVVEVMLLDVSLADAPAKVVAQTRFIPKGEVPVKYTLNYDTNGISDRHRYALRAKISVKDQMIFSTTSHHPVFTDGATSTNIIVKRVGTATSTPSGRWLAKRIQGKHPAKSVQTILEIAPDGAVSGTGGCNRIRGKANIDGERMRFGNIAATNMLCPPEAMEQESSFFAALSAVHSWRVDPTGRQLLLLDAKGGAMLVMQKM
ncbi:YbaY family lipoprotein [Roseovarius sp. MMSF_3281]|uniref:YbaY family lipoprotein n=1 Tax=Roseovarius sp. MMSF_3281 TaxID=3046694 RepID=UPI00273F680E|nr:YbaY family lipoprotein [Roseovarius sp. MMSF_3281]